MRTKALTIGYFDSSINESYLSNDTLFNDAAQYVMLHYKQHPINDDYYYDEENDRLFHVCSPSVSCNYHVYLVNPVILKCRGHEYKTVGIYGGKNKATSKEWGKFIKECMVGHVLA